MEKEAHEKIETQEKKDETKGTLNIFVFSQYKYCVSDYLLVINPTFEFQPFSFYFRVTNPFLTGINHKCMFLSTVFSDNALLQSDE